MRQLKSMCGKFRVKSPPFTLSMYGSTSFSILPRRLFANLTEKFKTVKFRKSSKKNKESIATEVHRMRSEEIIEPSTFH